MILNGIQQSEIQPVGCCAGQTVCANIADVYKVEEDGCYLVVKINPPYFTEEHATIPAVHKFYPILRQVQLV